MKKFSMFAAFLFALLFTSTALAADWVQVNAYKDLKFYVDKSSIKRGIESKLFDFSRADGCSAIVKMEFDIPEQTVTIINLVGFFEDNGVKKFIYLETLDENGNLDSQQLDKAEPELVDGSSETVWPKIYDYVQKNLP